MKDNQQSTPSRRAGCLIIFMALAGIGAFASRHHQTGASDPKDDVRAAIDAASARDSNTLYAAQAAIRAAMKDAGSAQFDRSFGWLKDGERVACGYVNGKNSFGALAGETPWLVRVDKGVQMIRSYENGRQFSSAWNQYCVGKPDDLKAAPKSFMGISFGDRIPAQLRASDAAKQVWLFRDGATHAFLDIPVIEPTFMSENGRVYGAQAMAKGRPTYDSLRLKMFNAYGVPTSDGGADNPKMAWDWGQGKMLARLSYNASHDQTTVLLMIRE